MYFTSLDSQNNPNASLMAAINSANGKIIIMTFTSFSAVLKSPGDSVQKMLMAQEAFSLVLLTHRDINHQKN